MLGMYVMGCVYTRPLPVDMCNEPPCTPVSSVSIIASVYTSHMVDQRKAKSMDMRKYRKSIEQINKNLVRGN
jgi:hypothetical protein